MYKCEGSQSDMGLTIHFKYNDNKVLVLRYLSPLAEGDNIGSQVLRRKQSATAAAFFLSKL